MVRPLQHACMQACTPVAPCLGVLILMLMMQPAARMLLHVTHTTSHVPLPRLVKMGYKPQLRRDFRLLTSFAISFTIVSVLTGLTGVYVRKQLR